MRFTTSNIYTLRTGTWEISLLERYNTIIYYRPDDRAAPKCTIVQNQFSIRMNFIGIDLISHENIRPDRLIWNFSIDQFWVYGNYLSILIRIFYKQRISTPVRTMTYNGHFPRILACYCIFQKMDSIYRAINEIIENSLILDICKFKRTAIGLYEAHHKYFRISLSPFRKPWSVMRIQLHIADESAFGATANPDTCP